MKKCLLLAALLFLSLPLLAQDRLPGGKWWKRPEVAQRLQLTSDQQRRLDEIFRLSADNLIDMKGEVEKRSIELRGELDRETLQRERLTLIASRLSTARGKLFERELLLLADMRSVLSDEQWRTLLSTLENRQDPGRRTLRPGIGPSSPGRRMPPPRPQ